MKLYREVLCPYCGKKYMTYVYDGEFDTVIKNPDKWMLAKACFFYWLIAAQQRCIYLGLATTYIGIPAFAGIPMREIDFYI